MTANREPDRPPMLLLALGVLVAVHFQVHLYLIFVHAPVEQQMGIVQKIFYFHVPSAYAMYVGFTLAMFVVTKLRDRLVEWWSLGSLQPSGAL